MPAAGSVRRSTGGVRCFAATGKIDLRNEATLCATGFPKYEDRKETCGPGDIGSPQQIVSAHAARHGRV